MRAGGALALGVAAGAGTMAVIAGAVALGRAIAYEYELDAARRYASAYAKAAHATYAAVGSARDRGESQT